MEELRKKQISAQTQTLAKIKDMLYSNEFACTCTHLVTQDEIVQLQSDLTTFNNTHAITVDVAHSTYGTSTRRAGHTSFSYLLGRIEY